MKKVKYKYTPKYPYGGNMNTGLGLGIGLSSTLGSTIQNNAYSGDGSVNNNQFSWGEGLSDAGKGAGIGAGIGSMIPLVGTGIGAGVGALGGLAYGLITGNKKARAANDQVALEKSEMDQRQKDIEEQKAQYAKSQQDNYNKAYYSANPINGYANTSIYKYGGPIKYPNGGRMSPSEWMSYNEKNGFQPHPKYVNTGSFNNQYIPYYDPNKFTPGYNPDGSVKWSKNDDPNYNFQTGVDKPLIQYAPSTPMYAGNTYMQDTMPKYANTEIHANGGTIHIKPSHKGRFTAYKERTGKTTEEALHSSDPHVRQMANFARNAAKWHHGDGGTLNPIASDITKAEGDTHEQGGITLANNGKPFAEVEDQEVIKDNNVYSDRLKLGDKTYAEIAEKLGRKKGKFEELGESHDYRDKNTAERSIKNIDNKLANLFNIQESSKIPVNNTSKMAYGGDLPTMDEDLEGTSQGFLDTINKPNNYSAYGSYDSGADTALNIGKALIPFADNVYNNSIINRTPNIVKPNLRTALTYKAMPMKTTVNVGTQLADANDYYKNFSKNIDENTSSSNVARGNKAQAYAETLRNRNDIYTNKQNTETGLVNQNNQNIQNVDNANAQNQQGVINQNYALLDDYNAANTYRTNNILANKSQNFAMATNDAQKLIQDSNMKGTDESRIMTDALKYNDGAGFARLIGTKSLGDLVSSNSTYYKQVESALKNSGQNKALNDFYKTYGKKK